MNSWSQLPLLRLLIPFILGLLCAVAIQPDILISDWLMLSILSFAILFIILYFRLNLNYNQRWVIGVVVSILFFVYGVAITSQCQQQNKTTDFSHYRNATDTVVAIVSDPVCERENTFKALLSIEAVKSNNKWLQVKGKAMTYFEKDSLIGKLKYGDKIVIVGSFTDVRLPQNPKEFDYKKYLAMRSVFTQGYVKTGNWKLLSVGNGSLWKSVALNLREHFLNIFKENNITGEEYAVSGALILGYTDKIDADLLSAYQGSGALHILSVSGMHVGVVYIVLNFILSFLDKIKKKYYVKPILILLLIWFYATITGFSPAVARAATMITFVIIGDVFGRNTNIYNTLAASILFLLMIDPLLIMDVGFQLSYVAVIGIVILQKKIYSMWYIENWLLKQLWLVVSVSIAAQLATFPLSLYYFHQFPNYFLLTNLIVVPLSNVIIYCGMLVLVLSPVSILSGLCAKVLVFLVYILNESICFVEGLPFSVSQGIYITSYETLIIYLGIGLLCMFFINKKAHYVKYTIACLMVFILSVSINKLATIQQRKMVVYSVKKKTVIDFISGSNHVLVCDTTIINNPASIDRYVKNYWGSMHLNIPDYIDNNQQVDRSKSMCNQFVYVNEQFVQFYDKRLAIINKANYKIVSSATINVDYLILSGNANVKIEDLLSSYNPGMIIIDSSNSLHKTDDWMRECSCIQIPCYSVMKSGAFELSI